VIGSVQQTHYLSLRQQGHDAALAAQISGVLPKEAELIDRDVARGWLASIPDAEINIPATGQAASPEESDMARPKKAAAPVVVEEHKPDFDLAVSIYRKDIKPAASKVGEHNQELSTAYKDIKKRAHIQPQAAKLAFKLDDMEESKRDDFLRSLNGLLKRLNIFMPTDLVDAAEGNGEAGEDVIPSGERARPQLASVPSDDSDLNGGEHAESVVDKAIAEAAE
jgi:hypothetical protein